LALKHAPESHTSENLIKEIKEVVSAWGLSDKVIAISADGASNIKKVNLKDEETEQQFMKSTEEDSGNRNKNVKTKLIQDMVVRWNSTLAMLTRLVLFSDHIR